MFYLQALFLEYSIFCNNIFSFKGIENFAETIFL